MSTYIHNNYIYKKKKLFTRSVPLDSCITKLSHFHHCHEYPQLKVYKLLKFFI